MSRKNKIRIIIGAGTVLVLAVLYTQRGTIRETLYEATKPDTPPAVSFREVEAQKATEIAQNENEEQTNTAEKRIETETTKNTELPSEIQLDVPFLLQAPKQNWVDPFEDACEEASLLMVDSYYTGKKTDFTEEEGVDAILKITAYEDGAYGHNKDTTTEEVGFTAKNYLGYAQVLLRDITSPDDIKEMLAKGYPVIVPAYGRALGNPNFRNGGPDYHMLVIKGYTADGYWITNDPGTRRGKGYVYREEVLMNALHEFHEGDMTKGAKRMIVLIP